MPYTDIDSRAEMPYIDPMNGNEFLRKIKTLGKEQNVVVRFDEKHGKGSHGRLFYGERFTTLKDRRKEIGPGLYRAMLAQLGLVPDDLK